MILRNHPTRETAIQTAVAGGYWPRHRYDHLFVLSNGKRELAIQREDRPRSTVFHLVDAPADKRRQEEAE